MIRTQFEDGKKMRLYNQFLPKTACFCSNGQRGIGRRLEGLEQFTHVILLYWLHKAKALKLRQKPFLDDKEYGIFAIRSPHRPNPIGMSVVELVKVEENRIYFYQADMLDKSPLLDVKPFVPNFDNRPDAGMGWLAGKVK